MSLIKHKLAAATAVAARLLSREDAATATIAGFGPLGEASLDALLRVRAITTAFVFDTDPRAERMAKRSSGLAMRRHMRREGNEVRRA